MFIFTPEMGGVGIGPKGLNIPPFPDAAKIERENPFDKDGKLKPGYSCPTVSKAKCMEDCANGELKLAILNPPPIYRVGWSKLGGLMCSDFAEQILSKCSGKCQ